MCLWIFHDFIRWSDIIQVAPLTIIRFGVFCWGPLGFLFLNFTYRLLSRKKDVMYNVFLVIYGIQVVLTVYTDLVLSGYKVFYWGTQSVRGILFVPVIFTAIVFPIVYSLVLIGESIPKTKEPLVKKNLIFLLVATLTLMLLATLTNVILPEFFKIKEIPYFASHFAVINLFILFLITKKYNFLSYGLDEVYEDLFKSMDEGVIILDGAGKIVKSNSSAKEILRITSDGTLLSDYINGYIIEASYKNELFKIQKLVKGETYIELSQGETKYSSLNKGKLVIFRDVSARIEAQKEKKDMQDKMLLASKLATVGELTSGVASEINNPLAILSGTLEMLQDKIGKGDEVDLEKLSSDMKLSVERISNIVKWLKFYSTPTEGNDEEIEVDSSLESSLNILNPVYKFENVKITGEFSAENTKIKGNSGLFQQSLMNIISNAKDSYGGSGGEIRVTSKVSSGSVQIVIADSGCGIEKEKLEKIFEPFFTTKGLGSGTGLGLWTSCSYIKALGGKITVDSTPRMGSTFEISIPCLSS